MFDPSVKDGKQLAGFDGPYRSVRRFIPSRFGPTTDFALSLVGGFAALTISTWLGAELFGKLIGFRLTALFDGPSFNTQPPIGAQV